MKKIILLTLLIITFFNLFSQSDNENMLKYWHYRNRLQYFVIPGTKRGESEVLSERNRMDNPPPYVTSNIGQHGVYFGYYLSVLATEYKLLHDNGQNSEAAITLRELDLALNQFSTYMDNAAEGYWTETNAVNGFFVRENMPCNFLDTNNIQYGFTSNGERHLDLFNKDLTPYNVWDATTHTFGFPAGHPGYSNFINAKTCDGTNTRKEPMSQDEAIGVLQGLALIYKYCPNPEKNLSKLYACNIISYIRNEFSEHGLFWWEIYQPNGQVDPGGVFGTGDGGRFAYGYVKASEYFNNSCIIDYVDPEYLPDIWNNIPDEFLWQTEQLFHNPIHDYNDDMKAILAAIGKSFYIEIPIVIGYCPLACYTTSIKFPSTAWGIKNLKSFSNCETFY